MEKQEKYLEYAVKLVQHISEIFNEESENHIDEQELREGDNLTQFIHALANLMPMGIYHATTGEEVNTIEFNHVANNIAIKYLNRPKEEGL